MVLWWSSRKDKSLSSHIRGTLQGSPWAVALGSLISRHKDRAPTHSNQPTRNAKIIGFSINFWQIINTEEPFEGAMLNFLKGRDAQVLEKDPVFVDVIFQERSHFVMAAGCW